MGRPLKMIRNAFYFTLNVFFLFLRYLNFKHAKIVLISIQELTLKLNHLVHDVV